MQKTGTSLVVHWLRFCTPNAVGLGSIPDQETRSHMLQLTAHMLQLKVLWTVMKIEDPMCEQPNK